MSWERLGKMRDAQDRMDDIDMYGPCMIDSSRPCSGGECNKACNDDEYEEDEI